MVAKFQVKSGESPWILDKNFDNFESLSKNFLDAARQNLTESPLAIQYLQWRGITPQKAAAAGVGFCEVGQNYMPCFIYEIQNENGDFLGVQWRNFLKNDFGKEPVDNSGKSLRFRIEGKVQSGFFHFENLQNGKPCFLCEGIFDFLAFYECGFNAVAVFGVNGAKTVENAARGKVFASPLILCGDFDKAGDKNAAGFKFDEHLQTIFADLDEYAGVQVLRNSLFHGQPSEFKEFLKSAKIKDSNDFLKVDRAAFVAHCDKLKGQALKGVLELDESGFSNLFLDKTPKFLSAAGGVQGNAAAVDAGKNEAAKAFYEQLQFKATSDCLDDLRQEIADCKAAGVYPTPFSDLNKIYGGGFQQSELYILAAPPAMGKTAFALQVADFVANSGKKVLYFSLEMLKTALMRRSLCRLSYAGSNYDNGFSTMAIKHGKVDDSRLDSLIAEANSFWKNETILAANFAGFTTTELQIAVDVFLQKTGERPLVIVDYFQILNASKEYLNDKQKADSMIFDLKKIATELGVAMFIVSAVNRASYDKAPTMNSLKESGAIEYTADGVGGLSIADRAKEDSRCFIRPAGGGDKVFNTTKYKELRKKEIQAYYENLSNGGNGLLQFSIEKNREGARGAFELYFNAARSTFYEENPIYEESPLKNSKRQKARRGVDYAAQIGNAAEVDDKSFPF